MVSFRVNGILVGDAAKNIMYQNADNTIKDSKKIIRKKIKKNGNFTIKENFKWISTICYKCG